MQNKDAYIIARGFILFVLGLLFMAFIIVSQTSCSGSRHVVKSSSKSDTTVVIKTETHKDSVVNTSTVSKTEEAIDNDIQTKDDYVEETTYYYGKDSNNLPTVTHKTTKRKGTQTTTDKSKKKTNIDVKNDTKLHATEVKKEDTKASGHKEAEAKDAGTKVGTPFGTYVIWGVIGLAVLAVIYVFWRFKKKAKTIIT